MTSPTVSPLQAGRARIWDIRTPEVLGSAVVEADWTADTVKELSAVFFEAVKEPRLVELPEVEGVVTVVVLAEVAGAVLPDPGLLLEAIGTTVTVEGTTVTVEVLTVVVVLVVKLTVLEAVVAAALLVTVELGAFAEAETLAWAEEELDLTAAELAFTDVELDFAVAELDLADVELDLTEALDLLERAVLLGFVEVVEALAGDEVAFTEGVVVFLEVVVAFAEVVVVFFEVVAALAGLEVLVFLELLLEATLIAGLLALAFFDELELLALCDEVVTFRDEVVTLCELVVVFFVLELAFFVDVVTTLTFGIFAVKVVVVTVA